jgi:hypothetical protein
MDALIAAITTSVISAIASEADPAKRAERIKAAVHAEIQKWAAIDPGLASARADAIIEAAKVGKS